MSANDWGQMIGWGFVVWLFIIASYVYDERLKAKAEVLREARREYHSIHGQYYNSDVTHLDPDYIAEREYQGYTVRAEA